jgi:hypothetical protein|uniref:Uncharacterized protein n=1 Tax=Zea mays TaxID=4577 RepID=C0PFT4_MAIZE|nr:unknown [Zea mays]
MRRGGGRSDATPLEQEAVALMSLEETREATVSREAWEAASRRRRRWIRRRRRSSMEVGSKIWMSYAEVLASVAAAAASEASDGWEEEGRGR